MEQHVHELIVPVESSMYVVCGDLEVRAVAAFVKTTAAQGTVYSALVALDDIRLVEPEYFGDLPLPATHNAGDES